MGTSSIDPIDLMVQVIQEHSPESIWKGSRLEGYRRLGNTNRGQIGEDFIRKYLTTADIAVGNGSRVTPTDLLIAGQRFEVKTASLGANGTFQFNHVSPNPPTRSGLGVGTRGEGRGTRRSALDSDKWGRWRPLVVVGGTDGGPGSGAGAGSAGQHAGEDNRGPGRCDSVGRLGSLVDGSGAVGAVRQAKAGLTIEPWRE